jgi:hypothetical protein
MFRNNGGGCSTTGSVFLGGPDADATAPLVLEGFDLSIAILIGPFNRQKGANTRSGSAPVCPFKSIAQSVLFRGETAWQISAVTLVAHNHRHHGGRRRTGTRGGAALRERGQHQQRAGCGGHEPREGEVMRDT